MVGLLGAVLMPLAPFAPTTGAENPPDVRFDAETVPFELDDRAELNPWGVTGIDTSGEERRDPFKANVLALEAHGDRMYVGGRFTHVRNGPNATPIPRPFLAAFDLATGEWISSFTPAVNGRVFDIEFTDDGKMIIGGDFSDVNGAPLTSGLAALDPITGAVDGSWHANVTRSTTGVLPVVRTIDEKSGWLYVGGVFSHVEGGTWNRIRLKNIAKLSVSNGSPESQFRPDVSNIVSDISVSPTSDRVHLVGNFSSVNGDTTHGFFATLDDTTGNPIAGLGAMQHSAGTRTNARYQHAVLEYGGHIYVGGSQHSFQKYTTATRSLVYSHITRQGGDFQAVEQFKGQLFGACHCGDWNYEGTNNWSSPSPNDGQHAINLVGQYNGTDFRYVPEWYPSGLKGDGGDGVWAMEGAGDCLWVGGEIDRSRWSGNAVQDFAGGFARFCGNDTTAPTTPTDVGASRSGDQVTVTFTRGTDVGGIATHEIYKDGVVIGTTGTSSFVDTDGATGGYYLVRAVDVAGNRSATLAPIYVPAAGVSSTLLSAGSVWRYQDSGAQAPAGWATPDFDDSGWASGPAHIGWGDGDEATVVGPTRPTTVYLRSTFNVSDPAAYGSLDVGLVRDDGAAVYINGVEVIRDNLPAGPLTAATPATDYVWGAAEYTPVPYVVPAGVLTPGVNTVAVELHQLGNPDASFDLSIDGQP